MEWNCETVTATSKSSRLSFAKHCMTCQFYHPHVHSQCTMPSWRIYKICVFIRRLYTANGEYSHSLILFPLANHFTEIFVCWLDKIYGFPQRTEVQYIGYFTVYCYTPTVYNQITTLNVKLVFFSPIQLL